MSPPISPSASRIVVASPPALPEIVRAFKTFSARRINTLRGTPGVPVWQRNYYEHIMRDATSLDRIRRYIADNPRRWAEDRENAAFNGAAAEFA